MGADVDQYIHDKAQEVMKSKGEVKRLKEEENNLIDPREENKER